MKTRIAAFLGVALMMAGCGADPTLSVDATAPALDGGLVLGSGNKSESDFDSTATGQNDGAPVQTEGGVVFGSGN